MPFDHDKRIITGENQRETYENGLVLVIDERVGEGRVSPHQDLVSRASAGIVALVQGLDQMEKRCYSYIATRRLLH